MQSKIRKKDLLSLLSHTRDELERTSTKKSVCWRGRQRPVGNGFAATHFPLSYQEARTRAKLESSIEIKEINFPLQPAGIVAVPMRGLRRNAPLHTSAR